MKTVVPAVETGRIVEDDMITGGLDFYKPTMSQLAHELHPNTEVTFTFKNRGNQRLLDYIDPNELQTRFDTIMEQGFTREEIEYLATLTASDGTPRFDETYLEHIYNAPLPQVEITIEDDDIAIASTGEWSMVTFWETIVMGKVNEAYFEGMVEAEGLDIMALYDEGARRLDQKIAILQANPDIKFSDFGNRRHFSLKWQKYVDERLKVECPENFIGTSNVALAKNLELNPIGTFAHEMPMVYAGIARALGKDVRASHNQFLRDWYGMYGADLSIALTDTFGSNFFFANFTPEQAREWKYLRQDSGNPFELGEKAIAFYEDNDVDPLEKTIVFSDGLDINDILALHEYFKGRINVVFGWGTTLTNDLGPKALNIVMKATHVRLATGEEADLVKLSDDDGKHTGPEDEIEYYQQEFAA